MVNKSLAGKIWKGVASTLAFSIVATVPGEVVKPVVHAAPADSKTTINNQVIQFKDVKSTHWAYDSIQWGVKKGLVVGYVDGTYKPKEQIIESEFVTVLSRYATNLTIPAKVEGEHWSQHFYKALKPYNLPLKGDNNKVAKNTALSRGQIAQIIAAKNGFNLDERQAIYYMYENDISYGLIDGKLSFDSYGKDQAVNREQIPAFFQRLDGAGVTTFMGKPSTVKPDQIGGIAGVPKDTTVITDEMFDKQAIDKGANNGATNTKGLGTLANPLPALKGSEELKGWHDFANANPSLAHSIVGKVNGIVTPVDMNVTTSDVDQGHILSTSLSTKTIKSGFHDQKLFFEVIDKNWTDTVLDKNQIKHIKDVTAKYLGSSNYDTVVYAVKGSKYDVVIGGTNARVNVNIYKKGWVDAAGMEIRK